MFMMNDLKEFIFKKKIAGLSTKSLRDYEEFITPFVKFCDCSFYDLSVEILTDYFDSLFCRNLSKSTIATYIRNVKIFLVWCEHKYKVDFNYSEIKVPKSPKKNPRIYSDVEIKQIFELIHDDDWLSLRNCSIVSLMLDSGLRRHEVITISRSDIHFVDGYLNVTGKGLKDRIVPLGEMSKNFILDYLQYCPYYNRFLFVTRDGFPCSDNTVKQFMRKYSRQLPFEFSSHKLRHNFATNFLVDNYYQTGHMDIYALMSILGHENLETTKRYLHIANQVVYSKAHISHLDNVLLN